MPDASAGFDGDTFYVGETNTAYDDVNVTVMASSGGRDRPANGRLHNGIRLQRCWPYVTPSTVYFQGQYL